MANGLAGRTLYTFDEAMRELGTDSEGFRQMLRYSVQHPERHCWIRACVDTRAGHFLATLNGRPSQGPHPNGTPALAEEGREIPSCGQDSYGCWAQCGSNRNTGYSVVFQLEGVFAVDPNNIQRIADEASGDQWHITSLLGIAPIESTESGTFPNTYFVIVSDPGPNATPIPGDARELFFMAADIERLKSAVASQSQRTADKPMDARERNSLLRIIRALDIMAKLPDRGAVTSVERQLQELGFDGPGEATIRKVLQDARALDADRKPQ